MSRLPISAVCVYCGSNRGARPAFGEVASDFGRLLAERGLRVIYGGGEIGLMGLLADSAMRHGGEVHGVITRALQDKEVGNPHITTLQVVETMHDRKAAMADAADAFVMLPGGLGTLEEFLEVLTWNQLGVHSKPCGILDVEGFFDPLHQMLDDAVEQGFLSGEHRRMMVAERDPQRLLDRLAEWVPARVDTWLDRSER